MASSNEVSLRIGAEMETSCLLHAGVTGKFRSYIRRKEQISSQALSEANFPTMESIAVISFRARDEAKQLLPRCNITVASIFATQGPSGRSTTHISDISCHDIIAFINAGVDWGSLLFGRRGETVWPPRRLGCSAC